uniref:Uncharacterized protein LOC104235780 n=1 Tax=Nicotiana sylvestris TaxID=4096 RepID=A0A1U7XE15_NICSY|nr:PREDICTED: uncharacterized protein LOC104235780 [Nicotiana sylvestris]
MDLDFALTEQKPTEPTTTSTADEKAKYEKWMKAKKLSLMIMKRSISDHKMGSVRDHIMKLVNIATKLNNLGATITNDFLVHQSLRSLPEQFNQLNIIHNAQKNKWSVDELITVYVVEEGKIQKGES